MRAQKYKKVAILAFHHYCEEHMRYCAMVERYLLLNKFTICKSFDVDLIIVIGCGATDDKLYKFEKFIRTINQHKNKVILMGCLAKTHNLEIRKFFSGLAIDLGDEAKLDKYIGAEIEFGRIGYVNQFLPLTNKKQINPHIYYIKISKGCLMKCTFCVIKKAHGYLVSESIDKIIEQYKQGLSLGYTNFYLMGTDSFAFGYDIKYNLAELIIELASINPNSVFYVGNLHPRWLIEYENEIKHLCSNNMLGSLQFALQHVNQIILRKMGRDVDFKKTNQIINDIAYINSEVFLSADFISGFPYETDIIFDELIDYIKSDTCLDMIQHFSYIDNKDTPAYLYSEKVRESVKLLRWNRMNDAIGDRLPQTVFNKKFIQTKNPIYEYYNEMYKIANDEFFFIGNDKKGW